MSVCGIRLEKNAMKFWMIDYGSNQVGLFRRKFNGVNLFRITFNVLVNMLLIAPLVKYEKMLNNYPTLWNTL